MFFGFTQTCDKRVSLVAEFIFRWTHFIPKRLSDALTEPPKAPYVSDVSDVSAPLRTWSGG
jgi:hypothetical protein